jgi:hypothetical protein
LKKIMRKIMTILKKLLLKLRGKTPSSNNNSTTGDSITEGAMSAGCLPGPSISDEPKTVQETKEYTPDPMIIDQLPENGIFVFGSNTMGEHYGGAARFAHQELEAEWGVGEGMTGRTYAFPTLNFANTAKKTGNVPGRMPQMVSVEEFDESMRKLFVCVAANPNLKFYLTKIGLGIAGWDLPTVKQLFWKYYAGQTNIVYPIEFEMTAVDKR